MTESTISVSAVGMVSSLGLDSATACAAARAGLIRLSEINTFNYALDPNLAKEGLDGTPIIAAHQAPVIGTGCSGIAKLLALSRPAFGELLHQITPGPGGWGRTAMLINVSDAYYQENFGAAAEGIDEEVPASYVVRWADSVSHLPERLCKEFSTPIAAKMRFLLRGGRVGVADLLQRAAQLIQSGQVDRCIVGAVESCVEPEAVLAYGAAGVLKCAANPAGFIPGEAAAYLMVERSDFAANMPGSFVVSKICEAVDMPYLALNERPHGRGMTDCIVEALSRNRDALPAVVVLDLNGTESRAIDWGYALVMLGAKLGVLNFETWLPAQSFGETGAAAGILALCMVFRAIERRHIHTGSVLVVLNGDDGRRAALYLEPATLN